MVAPTALFAAGLSLTPSVGEYTEGQTYSLSVFADPESTTVYTVKADLKYPSDLLEVKSFNFNSSWMPISQPGYDSIDNLSGTLIKSGGYPGGLSNRVLLGTISFYAKKSGLAIIEVTDDSMILDETSQDTFSGVSKGIFTIKAKPVFVPAPVIENTSTPVPEVINKKEIVKEEIPVVEEDTGITEDVTGEENIEDTETDNKENLASIIEADENFFSFKPLGYALILLVVFVAGLLIGRKTSLFKDFI